MNATIIAAVAAGLGSVLGAAATIWTAWITQRTQTARSTIEAKLRGRETLYTEFIAEASHLTVEALTNQLERPATFVKVYGILGRIRIVAADPVLAAAEACCRQVIELYTKPNMTIDQIRAAFDHGQIDPIKQFSNACRTEFLEIITGG
jgi:hypothetical protein